MTEPTTADLAKAITDACRSIRTLWPLLLTSISSGTSSGTPSSDTVTALDRRVDLSREVTAKLNSWARIIVCDLDLTEGIPSGNDLAGLCRLIERYADWLSGHESAHDCAAALRDEAQELRNAVAPKRREWVHLGTCTLHAWNAETEQVEPCEGRVRARVGSADGTASCSQCKAVRTIAWWQWELGLTKPPQSAEAMARILHDRMGVTVTGQTVRNWAKQGLIDTYAEPFGPAPQWPRFDQEAVMLQVAQMGRACQMCGEQWHGAGDLCTRCYVTVHAQRPRRAQPKVATPVLGARPAYRPPTVSPRPLGEETRLAWCEFGDMPIAWCACGHAHRAAV